MIGTKYSRLQACHLCSFNNPVFLSLTPVPASQVFSGGSALRQNNLLCPSATSFIKLSLLLQTGQHIPEEHVYFQL